MKHSAWATVSVVSFFPFTAALHHAVFYQPTCILNNFGPDYTFEVVKDWLSADPSPYIAAMLAAIIYTIGRQSRWTRLTALAFLIGTIPLTLWIWDIPFTDRIICRTGHDGLWPVRTLYLYAFAAATFLPVLYWLNRHRKDST